MKICSIPLLTSLVLLTGLLLPALPVNASKEPTADELKSTVELPAKLKPLPEASKKTDELKEKFNNMKKQPTNEKGKYKASSIYPDIFPEYEPNDSMEWADWVPFGSMGMGVFDAYEDLDFYQMDLPSSGDIEIVTVSNEYADHIVPVALLVKPNGEIMEILNLEGYIDEGVKLIFETIEGVTPGTYYVVVFNAEDDFDSEEPYFFDVYYTSEEPVMTFPDVKGTWAEPYVNYMVEQDLMNGYPDGTFGLNNRITRAEAAAVIARELELYPQESDFNDVSPSHWAYEYIGAMEKAGILSGYKDGTFRPNAHLSREEMAALLVKAYFLEGRSKVQFSDVSPTRWSYPYIQNLVANEIVNGYPDGTFKPRESIKRGEFAAMMARLLSYEF
ncbi:S-layer homology domain-containing protein [Halobacillus mangrovi]|uniref:S-layer homology domain-containing protein n=1 Tax=Halobacillus mangrovi TaxID=402384 RepID=UPI003D97190D